MFYDGRENENSAIVTVWIILFGEIKIRCCSAFCFGFREVGSVGVKGEDHVTGAVAYRGILMSSHVIEELVAGIQHGLGAIGLLRCNGTESSSKSWIHSL